METNKPIVTLFNMGGNPDDVIINQVGIDVHIRVKGRHMITISGVHEHIQREKNYPGHYTDIVVDRFGDKNKPREVIITLVHKKALTVEEIELTRPACPKCETKMELVDGCVFFYVYKCPKCGEEVKK